MVTHRNSRFFLGLTTSCALLVAALPLAAQSVPEAVYRQAFENAVSSGVLGHFFEPLAVYRGSPGFHATFYDIDDSETNSEFDIAAFKISPSYEFDPVFDDIRPYVELTLSYLDIEETVDFNFTPLGVRAPVIADQTVETFAAVGGLGASITLAEGTTLRPIFLAGYSRTSDDTTVRGPDSDVIKAAGRGLIFDAETNSFLVGGALELAQTVETPVGIEVEGKIRYNHFYQSGFDSSDPALDSNSAFGVVTARAEINGPTGATLFDQELRWVGFSSLTVLPGRETRAAVGFNALLEFGGGVELLGRDAGRKIEGLQLRSSAIVGPNVVGWSAGLSLQF